MKILLTTKADRQLYKLPRSMYKLILKYISKLSGSPFPTQSKKLSNRNGWRLRVGDYRILYSVDTKKKEITILSVAHRKEAYRLN